MPVQSPAQNQFIRHKTSPCDVTPICARGDQVVLQSRHWRRRSQAYQGSLRVAFLLLYREAAEKLKSADLAAEFPLQRFPPPQPFIHPKLVPH